MSIIETVLILLFRSF